LAIFKKIGEICLPQPEPSWTKRICFPPMHEDIRMVKTDTSGLIPTIHVGIRTFKYARGTYNTYDLRILENESPVQNTR
jgi:hypothetical protein